MIKRSEKKENKAKGTHKSPAFISIYFRPKCKPNVTGVVAVVYTTVVDDDE